MTHTNDPFLGTWILDPTQSNYESGTPPKSGSYTLETEGDGLKITMAWETAEGNSYEMSYFGIPDGQDYPYDENPAFVDTMSMTRVDARTLDSTAKKEGQLVLYARRMLSEDGLVMTVIQSGPTLQGGEYGNISVYRKVT